MSPYYTTLDCTQGHYSVHTDPALCGPLIDSGCTYASYFTPTVTPEVKVEQSSDLRAEQSLEMGAEQSSNLEVGWDLEWQKCEMGHPLTRIVSFSFVPSFHSGHAVRALNCIQPSLLFGILY